MYTSVSPLQVINGHMPAPKRCVCDNRIHHHHHFDQLPMLKSHEPHISRLVPPLEVLWLCTYLPVPQSQQSPLDRLMLDGIDFRGLPRFATRAPRTTVIAGPDCGCRATEPLACASLDLVRPFVSDTSNFLRCNRGPWGSPLVRRPPRQASCACRASCRPS